MSIGEKIKNRRIELGWSQQQLAERMGYTSKSTITRIEKGINDVSQKNIARFASVLGVSIAYLMDWDDDKDVEKEKPVTTLGDEQKDVLEMFNSASPEIRAAVLAVLKSGVS